MSLKILFSICLLSSILLSEGVVLLLSAANSPLELCDHQIEKNTEKENSDPTSNDPLKINKYLYGASFGKLMMSETRKMPLKTKILPATNPTEIQLPPPEQV